MYVDTGIIVCTLQFYDVGVIISLPVDKIRAIAGINSVKTGMSFINMTIRIGIPEEIVSRNISAVNPFCPGFGWGSCTRFKVYLTVVSIDYIVTG